MLSDVNRSLLQCPLRLAHHRKAGSASLLRFCIRPSITITRQVQSKCGAAHLAAPPALHPLQPSRQSNHRNTKQRDDTTPCDHAACSIAVFVACAAVPPFAPPPRCAVSHPPCRVFCTSTVPRPVRRRRAVLLHLRGACVRTVGSRHCGACDVTSLAPSCTSAASQRRCSLLRRVCGCGAPPFAAASPASRGVAPSNSLLAILYDIHRAFFTSAVCIRLLPVLHLHPPRQIYHNEVGHAFAPLTLSPCFPAVPPTLLQGVVLDAAVTIKRRERTILFLFNQKHLLYSYRS